MAEIHSILQNTKIGNSNGQNDDLDAIPDFTPKTKTASSVKPFSDSAYINFNKQKSEKLSLLAKSVPARKPLINVLFSGHVDAGKSTLAGHFICLLGGVDKSKMHKINKESAAAKKQSAKFAWLLDNSETERSRGVTVDVGTVCFETKSKSLVLLDGPGHKDFVPNMLAEASSADAAVLVIDCSTSNFESGFLDGAQTKEHAVLAKSLGISRLIVAMNKMDMVDWSKERYNKIKNELDHFLTLQSFKKITYVPVSGLRGDNLVAQYPQDWYAGPTFEEVLDSIKPPSRANDKSVRFCISGINHSFQYGNIACGKVVTGSVMVGEKLLALPVNFMLQVKSMRRNGVEIELAESGDNVEMAFTNDKDLLKSGFVICDPFLPAPVVVEFRCKIVTLKTRLPLTRGQMVQAYIHNEEAVCTVVKTDKLLDRKTGRVVNEKPKCVPGLSAAEVHFKSESPICMETFKENSNLSRIIFRRNGDTIAVGVVIQLIN